MIEVPDRNRGEMSRRARDALEAMQPVLDGDRTQGAAARPLRLRARPVRRTQHELEAGGAAALVHGFRGQPANHRHEPALRQKVLKAYRARYPDSGPTLAGEKLAAEGLHGSVESLRRWLLAGGLWERRRHRDPHRCRRPRRSCSGELVQMDASIHDGPEGRGDAVVRITAIDDATRRGRPRSYPAGAVEAHGGPLGRWRREYGRPPALYTDRHSIFGPHGKGQPLADPDTQTQLGRGCVSWTWG